MSKREGEEEGTKVRVTVVVSDWRRLRIAMTPMEELKLAETDAWLVDTVMLAVALERLDGNIYMAQA
jgi:hypothetical protein